MKINRIAILSLLLVAPAHAQDAPAAAQATAAPAAASTQSGKIAGMFDPPPAGKGQIIFFRPGGGGGMVGCMVREGEAASETHISKLTGNRYFIHYADPGVHKYWVKSEATDRLNLEIEPGETYFVKCKISMGLMVGRPNLSPSDIAEFEKGKKKIKLMDPEKQVDKNFTPAAAATK
ncbi:MAG: hypothetical protein V4564_22900 [Pseudomonadota bacterium]|uniref:hypothetical protein n=1 Tax=Sphingomonas sp. ERG5 TaxID=1381597 RepID=UPI00054BE956|nr:hypothetical protein [Sphingomonas sp. ERG5]